MESGQVFEKQMEEYGYVIDFLPYGKSDDPKRQPVLQLVGEKFFTLLEAYPKTGIAFTVGERVYVGRGDRDKVASIRGRVPFEELTSASRGSLREVTTKVIATREPEFVNFFNKCGPINIRVHQLELIPGIGKKIMSSIIDERDKKPFENFQDIEQRIHVNKLVDFLAQRIEEELQGSKYYLFVRPARYR